MRKRGGTHIYSLLRKYIFHFNIFFQWKNEIFFQACFKSLAEHTLNFAETFQISTWKMKLKYF